MEKFRVITIAEPNVAVKRSNNGIYITPSGKRVEIQNMSADEIYEAHQEVENKIEKAQGKINTLNTVRNQLNAHYYALTHTVSK